MSKRVCVQTFRREHDRFWILAAHPERNLFAAGHDSGLVVFKLERERPAYSVHGKTLYYIRDRHLRAYDFTTARETTVMAIRRSSLIGSGPRFIHYNPAINSIIICSDHEGGSYDVYALPTDSRSDKPLDAKRGLAASACYVARNRFVVLNRAHTVWLRGSRLLSLSLSLSVTSAYSPYSLSLCGINVNTRVVVVVVAACLLFITSFWSRIPRTKLPSASTLLSQLPIWSSQQLLVVYCCGMVHNSNSKAIAHINTQPTVSC
jgi:hypothetical protein